MPTENPASNHLYPLQNIVDIAEICAQKNVLNWVISPGSRSAPLTLAFSRHKKIKTLVINDERSAAFIALGISQQLNQPVGLICTSGSASLNFAPAIAEAFHQNNSLLILTADRPPEWINQNDGQAINQTNIYHNYIKKSYQLPVCSIHDEDKWFISRQVSEAINLTNSFPKGPVHINIPIREPFYPKENVKWYYNEKVKIIEEYSSSNTLSNGYWETIIKSWSKFNKVLIVAGQDKKCNNLINALNKLNIPVISDVISNLHDSENAIKNQDIFLSNLKKEESDQLRPELLITFGKSIISKNLKIYLRNNKPLAHWHIQECGDAADTFQSLTKIIRVSPIYFFENIIQHIDKNKIDYLNLWKSKDLKFNEENFQKFFKDQKFSEFEAVYKSLKFLPENSNLHLANSMSVRYANFLNIKNKKNIKVYSNRGTSGIDGCNSTVIGHCQYSDKLNVLITGDVAFFYDINAFWNNCKKSNLRIILLNNFGGGIFRMIKGPSDQPELSEYFESNQHQTAKNIASQFGIEYLNTDTKKDLEKLLLSFFKIDSKPKILEVFTDKQQNKDVLGLFKSYFLQI